MKYPTGRRAESDVFSWLQMCQLSSLPVRVQTKGLCGRCRDAGVRGPSLPSCLGGL